MGDVFDVFFFSVSAQGYSEKESKIWFVPINRSRTFDLQITNLDGITFLSYICLIDFQILGAGGFYFFD